MVRYLNPADCNPARITKADKEFVKKLDLKGTNVPVKIREIHKIEKKNCTGICYFGYENKEKHPIYVSKKCCEEKHVYLLLIDEEGKRHYVLIKNVNTFMYDHTLLDGKKICCCYYLQAFKAEEILNVILKTALKLITNKG